MSGFVGGLVGICNQFFGLVIRFVLCELCGGFKGFYIFIVCIVFGVVVIVGVILVLCVFMEGIFQEG